MKTVETQRPTKLDINDQIHKSAIRLFQCSEPSIEDYLKMYASQDAKRNLNSTYQECCETQMLPIKKMFRLHRFAASLNMKNQLCF
jgi:hypothetical protein